MKDEGNELKTQSTRGSWVLDDRLISAFKDHNISASQQIKLWFHPFEC